jgi:hypothetical protein
MRLDEFYNPESDQENQRKSDDVRKQKLTLKDLNKLRKYRDIKRLEDEEREKVVKMMYAGNAGGDAGGL